MSSDNGTHRGQARQWPLMVFLAVVLFLLLVIGTWTTQVAARSAYAPASRVKVQPTIPPLGIALNEVLPLPASDWNGDNVVDNGDEYIELVNLNDFEFPLGGWRFVVSVPSGGEGADLADTAVYTIPSGTTIPAMGYLAFYGSTTGLLLPNPGATIDLLVVGSDAVQDHFIYGAATADEAWSRLSDGTGPWISTCAPSPGQSNESHRPCCPDFNQSDVVDVPDIVDIAVRWNTFTTDVTYDRDGDGRVSIIDILRVAARTGDICPL